MSIPPLNESSSNAGNGIKTSSNSVIWQGPNIPCINLCTGDTISDVVSKLATLLCTIAEGKLSVESLDFSSLNSATPSTLFEALQLLVNMISNLNSQIGGITPNTNSRVAGSTSLGIIELPSCLYYTDEAGDDITSLPAEQYLLLLANTICNIISGLTYLQGVATTTQTDITAIQTSIDSIITTLSTLAPVTITAGCASNTGTLGELLPIDTAFKLLEANFCNLRNSVGSTDAVSEALSRQCASLNTSSQLMDPGFLMSDLAGWSVNPRTMSESVANAWLVLCDVRTYLSTLSVAPALPCIKIPQIGTQMLTVGTSYGTVSWDNTSWGTIADPVNYRVEVKAWSGSAPTGPVLFNQVVPYSTNSVNISGGFLVPDTEYAILVYSIYECGEAEPVLIVNKIITPTVLYKVAVTITTNAPDTFDCIESGTPVTYARTNKTATITLQNYITGLPVTTVADLDVVLRFEINGCDAFGPVYDDVTVTIPASSSSATYNYYGSYYINCGTATCEEKTKVFSCGVSIDNINAVFHPSITTC